MELTVTDDDGETNSTTKVVNIVGTARNIALNPSRAGKEEGTGVGFPHPLESDNGWGGGKDKWDMVDGLIDYSRWQNGLAFTGGKTPCIEPCGWRQATINFGEEKTFDRVRIWADIPTDIPRVYKIQYWDGTDWVDVFSTTNNIQGRNMSLSMGGGCVSGWLAGCLVETSFSPVTASKVRFALNNCDLRHGWIYEFEVYGYVALPVIPATIDFDPDTLNLKSEGKWVTTYIELPESYDVNNIDLSTVMLNEQVQAEAHPIEVGDSDNDGIVDLMVKFDKSAVQEILEVGEEVEITVTGELTDGTLFEGTDTVRVIARGKANKFKKLR